MASDADILAAVQATILTLAGQSIARMTINGRTIEYRAENLAELRNLERDYAARVAATAAGHRRSTVLTFRGPSG